MPSLPGEELTSKINGGAVLGLADGIKSTAVRMPSNAFAASKTVLFQVQIVCRT